MNTNETAEFIPSRDGLCDCQDQCEACGDCAYVETRGDWVVVGRFCGPDACRDEERLDEPTAPEAPIWRHKDGLVTFG